ncbi:MAG: Fe-S cluster assembly protein SufD [Bacteroidales bacterium]
MDYSKFTYAPSNKIINKFNCDVPLVNARQIYVIDGGVNGTDLPLSLNIDKNTQIKDLLQVISVRNNTSDLKKEFNTDLIMEEDSSARFLMCSHTMSGDNFYTDEMIKIKLEKNSNADIVYMQNEHNSATHHFHFDINLEEGSSLKMVFMTLHGGCILDDIKLSLNGEHANCDLSGLYLMDGNQRIENRIDLTHQVPNCNSSQLFKGILDDNSVGHFDGIIRVVKDAQKTKAYQANHNLILSDQVHTYAKPQLEIYADDVKCSHGASTGRLDEEELFYMRSRGISMYEAKVLQQMAFVYSVLKKISNEEIRQRMIELADARLRGNFPGCTKCAQKSFMI